MNNHELTIVIPTYNRPELFPDALQSALGQTVPVRIILSDDGDDPDRTAAILRDRFGAPCRSGQISHLRSGACDPWSNWKAGAEIAETSLTSFLQDDDRVSRHYAERITYAFGEAERQGARPSVWFGRLDCSDASGTMAIPLAGNGPMAPMRSLLGEREPAHYVNGQAVAPSMYLSSWSLSPALAYRNGPEFGDALAAMPPLCDIFVERIIPARMAIHGGFIADPEIIGYWRQHTGHLSHAQHPDQPRQTRLLIAHLDDLLDTLPDWPRQFAAWCGVIPPVALLQWAKQLDQTEKEGGKSRHGGAIREAIWQSLADRCRITTVPPLWRRGVDWLARRFARPSPIPSEAP